MDCRLYYRMYDRLYKLGIYLRWTIDVDVLITIPAISTAGGENKR
jgi:hypothetical protein